MGTGALGLPSVAEVEVVDCCRGFAVFEVALVTADYVTGAGRKVELATLEENIGFCQLSRGRLPMLLLGWTPAFHWCWIMLLNELAALSRVGFCSCKSEQV